LLLNGHGGNIDPLHTALRRLEPLFPQAILTGAAYWELAREEIAAHCRGPRTTVGHACEIETSMMLALRPELVRRDLVLDDLFWARDFGRRTHHGAVGHPESADGERGRLMLDAIVSKVTAVVEELLQLSFEEK
jgi:creatinine amidohydrolase